MKFSSMSEDELCAEWLKGEYWDCVCARVLGHPGKHVSEARLAEKADGVCFYCRRPLGQPHHPRCVPIKEDEP